jgi:lauroyl/myristoyl acyltransferase
MSAIKEGLSRGKGVLLVTGHFGGIEFIPGYLAANNYPVTVIVRFSSNHLRHTSIQKAGKFGTKIIDVDNTPNMMKAILGSLKENRVVIMLCDEIDEWRPSRHHKNLFLGKPINLDKTINVLLKRGDSAIVFGIMHRNNNHRYKFISSSWEKMAQKLRQSVDMSIGAVVLKVLEQYIYEFPEQWYQWQKYFFPFHGVRVEDPTSFSLLKHSIDKVA